MCVHVEPQRDDPITFKEWMTPPKSDKKRQKDRRDNWKMKN